MMVSLRVRLWAQGKGLDPAVVHEVWSERAAVREYLGGYPRHEAELLAESEVVRQTSMLDDDAVSHPPR